MTRIKFLIVLSLLFFQNLFAQETIELQYDTSGYQTSNIDLAARFDSSSLDTIPSVKGDMNVNEQGGMTYMLPIEVFKGVNNFQPNVALGYNSQSNNGQAGWGWNIVGLSNITQGGKSQYIDGITIGSQFSSNDPYYFDGQRLIKISDGEYQTEKYSKIQITKNSAGAQYSFVVKYTDGKIGKYKQLVTGQHYISSLQDALGNEVHYSYIVISGVPNLTSISYGGTSVSNDKYFINFIYNNRAVPVRYYRNGIQYTSSKVIKEVVVMSPLLTSNNGVYRKYELTHDLIQSSTVERLIKVEVKNENGVSLKPLQFAYNTSTSATLSIEQVASKWPTDFKVGGYYSNSFFTGLGSVAMGDFFGSGDVTPIYEIKYTNGRHALFASKSGSVLESGYTQSMDLYSGRALFDNKISENDVLIYSKTEYLGDSTNPNNVSGLVDKFTFKVRSLSPSKVKTITINLPGGLKYKQTHPLYGDIYERDKDDRKVIPGDFNNDGLFDIIVFEHSNNTRPQKVYFFEIGRLSGGVAPIVEVTNTSVIDKSDFYPIEFDGDGISELLAVDKSNSKFTVFEFDTVTMSMTPRLGLLNVSLTNFGSTTPLIFGDYNGDGLTDFITPHKVYNIEGSTAAKELKKIEADSHLWWQYTSNGVGFIKTQKDFTSQKIAYFVPSQRNIIKKSSGWDKFWSGKPDSYEYTEYGTSGIIPVDFNNDGKTDLVSVRKFGTVKYNEQGKLSATVFNGLDQFVIPAHMAFVGGEMTLIPSETVTSSYANKIFFHESKVQLDGSQVFNNLSQTFPLSNWGVSPLSLILNYNDFNSLNTYKSGLRIYDPVRQKDTRFIVNNSQFNEGQIRVVDNGSPVRQVIEYKPMAEKNNNNHEDVYTTTGLNLDYPFNVNKNLGVSYLVNKVHTIFDEKILTKEYRYENAIQSLNGKGFLGFQKTIISDPYESVFQDGKYKMKNIFTAHFWKVNTYDPELDNALILSTYGSLNYNSIFNKAELTHQRIDKGNNRYQILNTTEINTDYLKNITITKTYEYDTAGDLLLNQVNTNFSSQGSSIEKFYYQPEFSNGDHYFFGKINKTESKIFRGSDLFTTKEEQVFNTDGTVQQIKKYGNGTPAITTDFTYYPFGEVQTQTVSTTGVATALVTAFEYDSTNRFLTKTTTPDLLESVTNVNVLGRVLSEISPLGHTTSYRYDNWGNVKETTDFLGKKTRITKNITPSEPLGYYSLSTKREGGVETTNIYDIFDRVIKTKTQALNGQWVVKEIEYDLFGKKVKESEPYFEGETALWNTTEYDYLDRPIKMTAFNGKNILTCYEGLKVTVEDGHKKTSKWVDAMGNVVKVKDGGGEIFYKYYPNGSLKETNYEGIKTTIEIDGWGNKTKLVDPSAGTYIYEYDNLSRIKKEINPKGGVTEYGYNAVGKLISESINSPSENTVISKTFDYDGVTQLPTVVSGTSNGKSFTYTTFYNDPHYRMTGKKEETPDFKYETTLSYDDFGRVDETELKTTLYNPNHTTTSVVKNGYDANGILISQLDTQSGNTIWQVNTINSRGLTTNMNFGNGYTVQTNYNSTNSHLEKIKHFSDTQTIFDINYNYDNLKNVLNSRENLTFNKNETYEYDDLDRLLEEAVNGVVAQTYTYDKRGRMTSNSAMGKYNYNEQNYKLQSVNFNAEGAAVNSTRGFAEIQYNSFKNPTEVYLAGKDRISFEYSILKTRSASYYGSLSTTPADRPNRKYYSADKAVEIVKEGTTTKIITFITGDPYSANYMKVDILNNGTLVSNDKYFLHRDNQGTVLAITKADANGTVVEKRYFDAWGNLKEALIGTTNHTPNALGWIDGLLIDRGYTGHEHLKTVGLIHMNGRIYDPVLKRFMSPDNYVQDPHNTQSYNRYGYVFNNPLLYTDPSGEIAFLAVVGIAAAVAILTNGINNSINGVPFWYGAGRAGMMGGIAGAISFGIGSIATSTFSSQISQAAFQAGMHGITGGVMSEIEGGSLASGFASGAVSSMVSSGVGFLGGEGPNSFSFKRPALYKSIMISSGGLSGGIGSAIAGGNFWMGVRQGIITSGLNHAMHQMSQEKVDSEVNVLLDTEGASGHGHAAMLAGNDKKGWRFVSKEGRAADNSSDGQDGTMLTGGKSAILDLPYNTKAEALSNHPLYDRVLTYKTTYSTAMRAINATYRSALSSYHVLLANCGHAVADGLSAIGYYSGSALEPKVRYEQILRYNNNNHTPLNSSGMMLFPRN